MLWVIIALAALIAFRRGLFILLGLAIVIGALAGY